ARSRSARIGARARLEIAMKPKPLWGALTRVFENMEPPDVVEAVSGGASSSRKDGDKKGSKEVHFAFLPDRYEPLEEVEEDEERERVREEKKTRKKEKYKKYRKVGQQPASAYSGSVLTATCLKVLRWYSP
uniref:Uncharacterized protein n=1 Tax=Scleropages formosus TaxID=113540 RepID=A0A8C9VMZ4_SCLFO